MKKTPSSATSFLSAYFFNNALLGDKFRDETVLRLLGYLDGTKHTVTTLQLDGSNISSTNVLSLLGVFPNITKLIFSNVQLNDGIIDLISALPLTHLELTDSHLNVPQAFALRGAIEGKVFEVLDLRGTLQNNTGLIVMGAFEEIPHIGSFRGSLPEGRAGHLRSYNAGATTGRLIVSPNHQLQEVVLEYPVNDRHLNGINQAIREQENQSLRNFTLDARVVRDLELLRDTLTSPALRSITSLTVGHLSQLTPEVIGALSQLPLEKLELPNTTVRQEGMDALRDFIIHAPNLTELNLRGTLNSQQALDVLRSIEERIRINILREEGREEELRDIPRPHPLKNITKITLRMPGGSIIDRFLSFFTLDRHLHEEALYMFRRERSINRTLEKIVLTNIQFSSIRRSLMQRFGDRVEFL